MFETIIHAFCLVALLKNLITFKNLTIILGAIYHYNINMIDLGNLDRIISYNVIKSYIEVLLNPFEWGYKNIVPQDTYALIEPFIEKG